jgi:hypothetical protein
LPIVKIALPELRISVRNQFILGTSPELNKFPFYSKADRAVSRLRAQSVGYCPPPSVSGSPSIFPSVPLPSAKPPVFSLIGWTDSVHRFQILYRTFYTWIRVYQRSSCGVRAVERMRVDFVLASAKLLKLWAVAWQPWQVIISGEMKRSLIC